MSGLRRGAYGRAIELHRSHARDVQADVHDGRYVDSRADVGTEYTIRQEIVLERQSRRQFLEAADLNRRDRRRNSSRIDGGALHCDVMPLRIGQDQFSRPVSCKEVLEVDFWCPFVGHVDAILRYLDGDYSTIANPEVFAARAGGTHQR